MADSSLGTAVLRTRLDTGGLKTGLTQAKTETQRATSDMTGAIRGIGAAFGAVVASQGVRSYIRFLSSSASLAHQAEAAHTLFEKQIRRNNQSLAEGARLVDRLSDRFGVANSVIESSATLMLRQGASLDDVERALTAAGASAAAAGFDISTAFDNVATAVATGRSELLETSGIVANLGPVAQQYAKSVGKTVEELTQQELVQARVNAIYEETKSEIEDVDDILKGLPTSQANWTKEIRTFREDAGEMIQTVLVPLIDAGTNVVEFINALPEPVKRAGLAMSAAAIGATSLATGIVAIRAALTGFSALGLLSFGPAGWVVLGATAVAGLVAVLAGRPDSLDKAVAKASDALASGDTDSLIGALDETIDKLDGDVKTTFENFRDDLKETGRVGVEEAQKIARGFAALPELMEAERRVIRAEAEVEGIRLANEGQVITGFGSPDPANVEEMLRNTLAKIAPGFLDFLRFDEAGNRFFFAPRSDGSVVGTRDPEQAGLIADALALANRQLQEPVSQLAAAEAELAEATAALQALLARVENPTGSGGDIAVGDARGGAGGASSGTDPTGIVTSLPQRVLMAGMARFAAIDRALLDAMDDPVPPTLSQRAQQAMRERFTEIDRALLADPPQRESTVSERARQVMRERFAAIDRELLSNPPPPPTSLSETARAAARARFAEIDRALLVELEESKVTLVAPPVQAIENFGPVFRDGNRTDRTFDLETQRFLNFATQMDLVSTNADRAAAAEARLAREREAAAEADRQLLIAFDESERRRAQTLRSSGDAAEAYTAQAALQADVLRVAAREGVSLSEALQIVTTGLTSAQEAFGDTAGVLSLQLGRRADRGDGGLAEAKRIIAEEEAAADRFASTVIDAGFRMGNEAIQAIKDGDIPGLIRTGLGGIQSILGSANLGSIPFLGGSIGIGGIAAGVLGLFGTLIGALAGGGRSDADRARAEARRVGNVPAINLNFTVEQTNTYNGAPSDPANEQAFRRQADALFESLYRRHLGPRLDRIEQRLGIAGLGAA